VAAAVSVSNVEPAVELARNGWPILPLGRKKTPRIGKHPECRATNCAGGCGRDGHGVKDGTTDVATIIRWFTTYPDALIGARVPDRLMVIDIDPRHGGEERWQALVEANSGTCKHGRTGCAIGTLTVWSGRGDGGRHYYFLRPPGKLSEAGLKQEMQRLGVLGEDDDESGIDLKAAGGYTVLPPSLHPATGRPYTWEQRPPVAAPEWLVRLIVVPEKPKEATSPGALYRPPRSLYSPFSLPDAFGSSLKVADAFCARTTWASILTPHGWKPTGSDTEGDGAGWLHPHATSSCSATIRHGCLFVYSSNTPFNVTTPGDIHGYTKFRAYAVLNHRSDLSAAAKAVAEVTV
jgi:hypothetical protein